MIPMKPAPEPSEIPEIIRAAFANALTSPCPNSTKSCG